MWSTLEKNLVILLVSVSVCLSANSTALNQSHRYKLTFGSCSDQKKPQPLWKDVLAEKANMWLWLGDNIYADTLNITSMRAKYDLQKSNANYQKILDSMEVNGIWDDHDYGANDIGKEYPKKVESQQAFLDFLDVPASDIRRQRLGIYTSQIIPIADKQLKILYLDTRYFRDKLIFIDDGILPNNKGTILGEQQWLWLTEELANSEADIHIFASSIQFLAEQHDYEKWANFPRERQRFLKLIKQYDIQRPIFLTGDRHIGEISTMKYQGKIIYDVTSSSLNRPWRKRYPEENNYRLGKIVYDTNYGMLDIAVAESIEITAYLRSQDGVTQEKRLLAF